MTPRFSVRTTPHFERLARALLKGQPQLRAIRERAVAILENDPYNHRGAHHIKRLSGIPSGNGEWRLSLGRFRFRYDIAGAAVVLQYCGLRREDTYRDH